MENNEATPRQADTKVTKNPENLKKRAAPRKAASVTKVTKLVLKPKKEVGPLKSKLITTKYTSQSSHLRNKLVITKEASFRIHKYERRTPELSKPPRNQNGGNKKKSMGSIGRQQTMCSKNQFIENNRKSEGKMTNSGMKFKLIRDETFKLTNELRDDTLKAENGSVKEQRTTLENIGKYTNKEHNESFDISSIIVNQVLEEITTATVNSINLEPIKLQSISATSTPIKKDHRNSVARIITSQFEQNLSPSSSSKCKKKSYDPVKARNFIKEQQIKRKTALSEGVKGELTKEQIKQRLANLQKNSLKIIGNNVKRARTRSMDLNTNKDRDHQTGQTRLSDRVQPSTNIMASNHENGIAHPKANVKNKENEENTPLQSKINSDEQIIRKNRLLSERTSQRRIGIMRRQDDKNTAQAIPSMVFYSSKSAADLQGHPESGTVTENLPLQLADHHKSIEQELKLKVPESLSLKSSVLMEQRPLHKIETSSNNLQTLDKTIPFWLKPSPVQPYPYNFIMAVRKKLESITNPVAFPKKTDDKMKNNCGKEFKTPAGRPVRTYESRFKTNLELKIESNKKGKNDKDEKGIISSQNLKSMEPSAMLSSPQHVSRSLFSITPESGSGTKKEFLNRDQNFLSSTKISGQNPINIVTIESDDSQNALSVSSGTLSHSSQEKQQTSGNAGDNVSKVTSFAISPLSTDHIDGMHIVSKSNSHKGNSGNGGQSHISSHINFSRGSKSLYDIEQRPVTRSGNDQVDIHQMLQDFNESLSQVIKVNEKLHNVLSNPPSRRQNTSIYSDDFDEEVKISEKNSVPTHTTYSSHFSKYGSNAESLAKDQTNSVSISQPESNRSAIGQSSISLPEMVKTTSTENSTVLTEESVKSVQSSTSPRTETQIETTTAFSKDVENEESSILTEKNYSDHSNRKTASNSENDHSLGSDESTIKKTSISDDLENGGSVRSHEQRFEKDDDLLNTSIGSDIFAVFNRTSLELSNDLQHCTSWSEGNISYSSLGMYEQLIQAETQKTKHLSSLLRLREKSLIDRFKGQIAWLELKKQKMKEQGLTDEISTIKKKQRALLIRLEKDRNEIHRLLKLKDVSSVEKSSNVKYKISHLSANMSIRRTSISNNSGTNIQPNQALKAIELEPGNSLELVLQKREDDLRRRREHVEKLLKWHQRLDDEEREVREMERLLMMFSTTDAYSASLLTSNEHLDTYQRKINARAIKMTQKNVGLLENGHDNGQSVDRHRYAVEEKQQKHIRDIEESLRTLQNISSRSIKAHSEDALLVEEEVHVGGKQLNRLWKRLTGQMEEKFIPSKSYILSKKHLESIYEEAKEAVLRKFDAGLEWNRIIDSSSIIGDVEGKSADSIDKGNNFDMAEKAQETSSYNKKDLDRTLPEETVDLVPSLNLNFSPEPSLASVKENLPWDSDQGYYFTNDNGNGSTELQPDHESGSQGIQLDEQNQDILEQQIVVSGDTVSSTSFTKEYVDSQISGPDFPGYITENHESEDIQSDITEDSLNNANSESHSTINTALSSKTATNPEQVDDEIPEATDQFVSNESIDVSAQLIENISFPQFNITMMTTGVEEEIADVDGADSMHNTYTKPEHDDKYLSDDFETIKTTDKTMISDRTSNSVSDNIPTDISSTQIEKSTSDDNKLKDLSEKSDTVIAISRSPSPRSRSPSMSKELEQRLIDIDDSLKDLRETISRSPVFELAEGDRQHVSNSTNENEDMSSSIHSTNDDSTGSGDAEPRFKDTNEENKENISSENVAEKSTRPDFMIPATILPVSMDMKIRGKKVNENFPLGEIYPKVDIEQMDVTKYTTSTYIRDYSIDFNKEAVADVQRQTHSQIDPEAKQPDANVSFPVLREIPNKPPPPYPSHRHPVPPIMPSDHRIKEIVYGRMEQLYSDLLLETEHPSNATYTTISVPVTPPSQDIDIHSPSSPIEASTNVYERIFYDICDEFMADFKDQQKYPGPSFKQPLSFYNPPNRLTCLQEHVLGRIYKLLGRQSGIYSDSINAILFRKQTFVVVKNRRKRDLVDEILIQELMEDEQKWTNFDLEELEVQNNISDDIMALLADESIENTESSNEEKTSVS